jgi:predicted RNA-binding Zn ribbon-like protein
MSKRFKLLAGHPVLDFANTLDYRYEPEKRIELLESPADLIDFGRQSSLLMGVEIRALDCTRQKTDQIVDAGRDLRETIERIFSSAADDKRVSDSDLKMLNSWVAQAAAQRKLEKQKSSFVWTWKPTNSLNLILWRIAYEAADLLVSPECRFVRRCDAASCRWLFLDKSKNHSRRWCDMKICGNREKARTYYRRLIVESSS